MLQDQKRKLMEDAFGMAGQTQNDEQRIRNRLQDLRTLIGI